MPKLFDIMAPMGQYTDPNTGQEKTRWLKCGAIIKTGAGKTCIKLDSLPVAPMPDQNSGEGGLWLQCFEPQQQGQQGQQGQQQGQNPNQGQGFRQNPAPPNQNPAPERNVPYTDPNFQGAPTPNAPTPPAPQDNNPPW